MQRTPVGDMNVDAVVDLEWRPGRQIGDGWISSALRIGPIEVSRQLMKSYSQDECIEHDALVRMSKI